MTKIAFWCQAGARSPTPTITPPSSCPPHFPSRRSSTATAYTSGRRAAHLAQRQRTLQRLQVGTTRLAQPLGLIGAPRRPRTYDPSPKKRDPRASAPAYAGRRGRWAMRIDVRLVGVAMVAWLAGPACSSTSSKNDDGSAGTAGASSPVGGSSAAGASGSGQAGASPVAGSSGSSPQAGSANVGGAGAANAGGAGGAGSANVGGRFEPGVGGLASNLEPDVCASVAYEQDGPSSAEQRAACQVCCNQAEFNSFGSYEGKCLCATPVPADSSVCPQSTAEVCTTCCNEAGFAVANRTSAGCFCYGTGTLCANAAGDPNLCRLCCTEHGYLAWSSSSKQCTCTN